MNPALTHTTYQISHTTTETTSTTDQHSGLFVAPGWFPESTNDRNEQMDKTTEPYRHAGNSDLKHEYEVRIIHHSLQRLPHRCARDHGTTYKQRKQHHKEIHQHIHAWDHSDSWLPIHIDIPRPLRSQLLNTHEETLTHTYTDSPFTRCLATKTISSHFIDEGT